MKKYIDEINIIKKFMNDIEHIKYHDFKKINFDFYNTNFEKILFYISKSFISDNFEELFSRVNNEVLETVFEEKVILNPELDHYSSKSIYLFNNQHFVISDTMKVDLNYAYKIIRNNLCHFCYTIKDNIVYIEDRNTNEHIEFSIASLHLLLRDTLCTYGQSHIKGAYEYLSLLNMNYMLKIQNITDNMIPPAFLVDRIVSYCKDNNLLFLKSNKVVNEMMKYIKGIGNYYVRKIPYDENIFKKANINRISNQVELDMYMCAFDDVKRAGITYNKITDILFALKNNDIDFLNNIPDRYYSIISNTVFISYMSLVFDDYFIKDFEGVINTDLFYEKPNVINHDIPRKFRNSLAHSRYRFENIFDSSKGIIIEFWDEYKNTINFKCKITKNNACILIDEYISEVNKEKQ